VVKIFAFLDLEQISGDFEIEHFETASSSCNKAKKNQTFYKITILQLFAEESQGLK